MCQGTGQALNPSNNFNDVFTMLKLNKMRKLSDFQATRMAYWWPAGKERFSSGLEHRVTRGNQTIPQYIIVLFNQYIQDLLVFINNQKSPYLELYHLINRPNLKQLS